MVLKCKVIDCKSNSLPYGHLVDCTLPITDIYARDGKQYLTVIYDELEYNVLGIDTILESETVDLLSKMVQSRNKIAKLFNRSIGNYVLNDLTFNVNRELDYMLFSIKTPSNSAAELHDKWVEYMKQLKWEFGTHNNDKERISNHLVSFNELPTVLRELDELLFEHIKLIRTLLFTNTYTDNS